MDFAPAFPSLFVILLFAAVLSPGPVQLILQIGCTGWMGTARLVWARMKALFAAPSYASHFFFSYHDLAATWGGITDHPPRSWMVLASSFGEARRLGGLSKNPSARGLAYALLAHVHSESRFDI